MSQEKPETVHEPPQEKAEEKVDQKTEVGQAPTKKELSYTYWVDQKNKSRELPEQHRPKKIEVPVQMGAKLTGNGPSHWNTSGTWQQRSISTKELNETSKEVINKWLQEKKGELVLTQVELEGEFKKIFSNNKRKIMYELTGKIKFEGDDLYIKIQELTCSGDQEYSIKGKKKEQKQKLKIYASKMVSIVVQNLSRYKE